MVYVHIFGATLAILKPIFECFKGRYSEKISELPKGFINFTIFRTSNFETPVLWKSNFSLNCSFMALYN